MIDDGGDNISIGCAHYNKRAVKDLYKAISKFNASAEESNGKPITSIEVQGGNIVSIDFVEKINNSIEGN